jgi:hypothetical protein
LKTFKPLLLDALEKNWLPVLEAINDNGLDGEALAEYMKTPESLLHMFNQDMNCQVSLFIVKQLHRLICKAAKTKNDVEGAGKQVTNSKQPPPLPLALQEKDKHAGVAKALTAALRVQYTHHVAAPNVHTQSTRITVEVPQCGTVATVLRCILEYLKLALGTPIQLFYEGKLLVLTIKKDWHTVSCVYANRVTTASNTGELTMANVSWHPAVTVHVGDESMPMRDSNNQDGWTLTVLDKKKTDSLGSGAFGIVCKGYAVFLERRVAVAVKKFFMLENPQTYYLNDAEAISDWVTLQLLPELNTLLGLNHPNLVKLRCIGLRKIYGTLFPAYVAMDLCDEGTLEQWLRDGRVTDTRKIAFLQDLVAGIVYLHVEKHVVHRDLKPANIFIKSDVHHNGRATLILGDVGLAKTVAGTKKNVSAAGTPLYLAPDAIGGGAHCSLASDVYSASVIAVEIVTGEVVHNPGTALPVASRTTRLVFAAQACIQNIFAFAQDVDLTTEAVNLLLAACKFRNPSERPTCRQIQDLCKRRQDNNSSRREGGAGKTDAQVRAKQQEEIEKLKAALKTDAQVRAKQQEEIEKQRAAAAAAEATVATLRKQQEELDKKSAQRERAQFEAQQQKLHQDKLKHAQQVHQQAQRVNQRPKAAARRNANSDAIAIGA